MVSVAYRLAPEHVFPAAVESSLSTTTDLSRRFSSSSTSTSRLFMPARRSRECRRILMAMEAAGAECSEPAGLRSRRSPTALRRLRWRWGRHSSAHNFLNTGAIRTSAGAGTCLRQAQLGILAVILFDSSIRRGWAVLGNPMWSRLQPTLRFSGTGPSRRICLSFSVNDARGANGHHCFSFSSISRAFTLLGSSSTARVYALAASARLPLRGLQSSAPR